MFDFLSKQSFFVASAPSKGYDYPMFLKILPNGRPSMRWLWQPENAELMTKKWESVQLESTANALQLGAMHLQGSDEVGGVLGFFGSLTLLFLIGIILFRIIKYSENAINIPARIFLSGLFLTLFAQVFVHTGMNMGIMPITGVPFPLVSAGGSSLISTMIALGIVVGTKK